MWKYSWKYKCNKDSNSHYIVILMYNERYKWTYSGNIEPTIGQFDLFKQSQFQIYWTFIIRQCPAWLAVLQNFAQEGFFQNLVMFKCVNINLLWKYHNPAPLLQLYRVPYCDCGWRLLLFRHRQADKQAQWGDLNCWTVFYNSKFYESTKFRRVC